MALKKTLYPPRPPLAELLRPNTLADFVGQQNLVGSKGSIHHMVAEGFVRSMILWGPPGVGKTTLARIIAHELGYHVLEFSGARAQIKEIRDAVDAWMNDNNQDQGDTLLSIHDKKHKKNHITDDQESLFMKDSPSDSGDLAQKTPADQAAWQDIPSKRLIVFVDEIHRYNKAQQDYFLPWIEQGLFTLIGATTENPGFEVNSALLSRCAVMVLEPLTHEDLTMLYQRGVKKLNLSEQILSPEALRYLISQADGDGRRLLNDLESVMIDSGHINIHHQISADIAPIALEDLKSLLGRRMRRFDKGGDQFYDQISALHKSVRGSDPDAALYWLMRMLDGGCEPMYVARRLIRMAVEDVGLADPRALGVTLEAWQAYERLGSPEGELALAQAVIYLAALPKSNAVYSAYKAAKKQVAQDESHPVPMRLKNAANKVLKDIGAGAGYRYAHDEEHAYAAHESYWPDHYSPQQFYKPTTRGLEAKIAEHLKFLKSLEHDKSKKK